MNSRIYNEKIKNIKESCRICSDNSKMISNGYLELDKPSKKWMVEFVCEDTNELYQMWDRDYEPLIQEVLKDEGID